MPATLDEGDGAEFAWKFWSRDWPEPGRRRAHDHSRAIDTAGNVQPAMTDPPIANKRTYWESNGQITRPVGIGSLRRPRPAAEPPVPPAGPGPRAPGRRRGRPVRRARPAYPEDQAVYTINLQVSPDRPELLERAGFRVYGPIADKHYVAGGAQPGLRPNVSGNLISQEPGEYVELASKPGVTCSPVMVIVASW